jgi:hypothetical protein
MLSSREHSYWALFVLNLMTHHKARLWRNAFSHRKLVVRFAWLAISTAVGIGTELLARREKIEVTGSGLEMCAVSGADGAHGSHGTRAVYALSRRIP